MGGSGQIWLNSACHMSENAERPIKRLLFDLGAPTHPLFCFIVLLPAYGTSMAQHAYTVLLIVQVGYVYPRLLG
jgi:hypothetical protein